MLRHGPARHDRLALLGLLVAGWLPGIAADPARAAGDLPHVVYVLADDLGYGDTTVYNPASAVPTPHIDALAAAGMRFTNAHAPSSVCTPSRYALLTGEHPYRIGRHVGVAGALDDEVIPAGRRTVAGLLRDRGYRTAMIGKWHLGFRVPSLDGQRPQADLPQSNVDWGAPIEGGPLDHGFDHAWGLFASADIPPYKIFENDGWLSAENVWLSGADAFGLDFMRPGQADPDWDPRTLTRRVRDRAADWIRENAGGEQPLFLYLSLPAPHTPTAPHPDFEGTTPYLYTDFVREVDDVVGRIVSTLDEEGILEDSLVFFTSDNGANGNNGNRLDHQATGVLDGVPLRGQKGDAWEGGHRVPLVVRWGDGTSTGSAVRPNSIHDGLVDLTDLMATLASVCGAVLGDDEGVDSYDLGPVLLGGPEAPAARAGLFGTSSMGVFRIQGTAARGRQPKLILGDGSGGEFSLPSGTVLDPFEVPPGTDAVQLYDLGRDPGETRDLLSDGGTPVGRRVAFRLRGRLLDWLESGRSAP